MLAELRCSLESVPLSPPSARGPLGSWFMPLHLQGHQGLLGSFPCASLWPWLSFLPLPCLRALVDTHTHTHTGLSQVRPGYSPSLEINCFLNPFAQNTTFPGSRHEDLDLFGRPGVSSQHQAMMMRCFFFFFFFKRPNCEVSVTGMLRLRIFFFNLFYLFIYFWLHWVFIAVHGLSLVTVSRGYSSLQCAGFSLWWLLLL